MYQAHFGLTHKPFSIVPNPEILFLSESHEQALTYLEYGLNERLGFILLTGEIGSGKTTLIRHMLNQVESQLTVAVIFNTNFSSDQFFRKILNEFEIPCNDDDKERHLDQLYRFLIDCYAKNRHVLLVIDEAQNLADEAIEEIRMLSNLQTDDASLLQILLVGQPELRSRLEKRKFQQLAQRIAVNFHIPPLDEVQTSNYIVYRIRKAGGESDLFTPEAIKRIYEQAGGIPRSINLLCDTSLVYGFSDGREFIDQLVVEKVIEDGVCMSTGHNGSSKEVTFNDRAPQQPRFTDMELRIQRMEESIFEIKQKYENLSNEVKGGLLANYQQLLLKEQDRYNTLLEKYTLLLKSNGRRP